MTEGHFQRGLEQIVPKFARDVLQAARFTNEGATTMRGDALIDDFTTWELFLKANGFTPDKLADRYDENNRIKNAERRLMKKRASLMTLYWNAHRLKDTEMKAEAKDQINAWNRQYPKAKIKVKQIIQSIDKRQEFSRKQKGGVVVGKRFRNQVEAYR